MSPLLQKLTMAIVITLTALVIIRLLERRKKLYARFIKWMEDFTRT